MNKDIEKQCNSVTSVTRKGQAVKQTIPSYVRLQLGFQEWLGLLGYSNCSVQDLPRKVGIFLDWLCAREGYDCLLYTSPSPRDGATSRMPSSA